MINFQISTMGEEERLLTEGNHFQPSIHLQRVPTALDSQVESTLVALEQASPMKENRRVVIKSTIAPQRKGSSASRSGSRENRVRQQSSGKRRVRSPSPHSTSKGPASSYGINFTRKDVKSKHSKQSESKRQPLGNISQISARDSNHRQSQQQANNDLTTELDAFQQHTFAELHKRIELLES